jgi:small GTP-binding protein
MKYLFKIVLGGEGGVGKTTLLYRLKTGSFMEDTKMTIGVDFYPHNVKYKGHDVTLQIWDLGGQDRFQFMHQNYCKGAKLGILMYDLSRYSTVKKLEENWLPIVRTHDAKLPIILIGSKLDLVDQQDAMKLVFDPSLESIGAFEHLLISSKTGEGVMQVFDRIAERLVDNK